MLRIHTQGTTHVTVKDWVFNRRNINKIAYNYDAEVIKFDLDIRFASLRSDLGGFFIMIDEVAKRYCTKCHQLING